ncbi:MAG: hypothetical protein LBD17_01470, partial [Endomicrobium sp.]|nr:hypothetical protein [Endomicrobium sp.]
TISSSKNTRTVVRKIGEVRKENPYYGKVKILELLLRENIELKDLTELFRKNTFYALSMNFLVTLTICALL